MAIDEPDNKVRLSKKELVHRFRTGEILEAAHQVVNKRGLDFNLDQIAAEAGVAKGTIYLYFKNKEDLIFKLIGSSLEVLEERSRRALLSEGTFAKRLRSLIYEQLAFLGDNRRIFLVLDLKRGETKGLRDVQLRERMRDRISTYIELLSSHFEDAMWKGEIRPIGTPEKLAHSFSQLVEGIVLTRPAFEDLESLENEADYLFDLFFHGIELLDTDE